MTPIAYWNFEDYVQNSGFKDKINNIILRPSSVVFPEVFSILPNSVIHGVRGSGAILYDKSFNSQTWPMYSSVAPNVGSNNFSIGFWCCLSESIKSGYNQSPRPEIASYLQISKSVGDFFSTSIGNNHYSCFVNNSGIATFTILNSGVGSLTVSKEGLDVGRWNFIYVENDRTNSRLGISVNAKPKTYTNYPGGFNLPNLTTSGNLTLTALNNFWSIDELGFWQETLSQDKLLEYYHNICPFSYSGKMDHQWTYPQEDKIASKDETSWFADRLASSSIPFGERWEYVNEGGDSNVLYGSFPAFTDSQNNLYASGLTGGTHDVRVRFGTGKLFIRPSSAIGNYDLNAFGMDLGQSGMLRNFIIYDKNSVVIASANITDGVVRGTSVANTQHSKELTVYPNQYWDLTDTSIEIVLTNFGGGFASLTKVNALISGTPIFETGLPLVGSGGPSTSTLDLYECGMIRESGNLDLYMRGYATESSGLPLFIFGVEVLNSSIPLYMNGYSALNSGFPLYIQGGTQVNGNIPLFINGVSTLSGSMPLFIMNNPIAASGGMPLSTYGHSGYPTVFGGLPLTLLGNDNLSTYSTMPLYISGPLSGQTISSMPLFLDSNTIVTKGVDLFLKNAYIESGRQLRLFIGGDGLMDGALPYANSMPLYIERTEGVDHGMSLYIKTNDGIESGFPLYINAVNGKNSGIPLFITALDRPSGTPPLFICGF